MPFISQKKYENTYKSSDTEIRKCIIYTGTFVCIYSESEYDLFDFLFIFSLNDYFKTLEYLFFIYMCHKPL